MASFTDAQDREWTVFIDVPTIKMLQVHKLDVLNLFDDGFDGLEKLVNDPIRLVDTISLVCQDQIKERDMDDVAFAKSLYGDALARAVDALVEGVTDFFHDPKRRESIRAVFRKAKEVETAMFNQAAMEIDALDVDETAKRLRKELVVPSTNSQGLSASTHLPED